MSELRDSFCQKSNFGSPMHLFAKNAQQILSTLKFKQILDVPFLFSNSKGSVDLSFFGSKTTNFVLALLLSFFLCPTVHSIASLEDVLDKTELQKSDPVISEIEKSIQLKYTQVLDRGSTGEHYSTLKKISQRSSGTLRSHALHHGGWINDKLFKSKFTEDGVTFDTLIKTYKTRFVSTDEEFDNHLLSYLRAEYLGGSKVFAAGTIYNHKLGEKQYFIEFEEFFRGQRQTFTLKGYDSASIVSRWIFPTQITTDFQEALAQLFYSSLFFGISLGSDFDFVGNKYSGELHFIDPSFIIIQPSNIWKALEGYPYSELLDSFRRVQLEVDWVDSIKPIVDLLLIKIRHSHRWNEKQKAYLFNKLYNEVFESLSIGYDRKNRPSWANFCSMGVQNTKLAP